jgi:hypothetical protein
MTALETDNGLEVIEALAAIGARYDEHGIH